MGRAQVRAHTHRAQHRCLRSALHACTPSASMTSRQICSSALLCGTSNRGVVTIGNGRVPASGRCSFFSGPCRRATGASTPSSRLRTHHSGFWRCMYPSRCCAMRTQRWCAGYGVDLTKVSMCVYSAEQHRCNQGAALRALPAWYLQSSGRALLPAQTTGSKKNGGARWYAAAPPSSTAHFRPRRQRRRPPAGRRTTPAPIGVQKTFPRGGGVQLQVLLPVRIQIQKRSNGAVCSTWWRVALLGHIVYTRKAQ